MTEEGLKNCKRHGKCINTKKKKSCFLETEKQLGCAYKFTVVKTVYAKSASGQPTFQRGEKRWASSPITS